MFKRVYKFLIVSVLFLSMVMSVNAGLCLPFFEKTPVVNSVNSVFDENLSYLGQLSELNNTIQENWFIKVNMGSTTDFNNNINFERVNILSNALYSSNWNFDEVSYTNLNTYIQTKAPSSNSFDFYQYLNGSSINGGIGQYFTEEFKFFSGGALQYAFHNLSTGFYDILLRATDDCGNTDYKFIPLEVKPKPNPISYSCTGNLIVTGTNKDVLVGDTCSQVTLDVTTDNINFYYTGTSYNDINEKPINLVLQGVGGARNVNVFANEIAFTLTSVGGVNSNMILNANFNNFSFTQNVNSYGIRIINMNGDLTYNTGSYKYSLNGLNNVNLHANSNNYDVLLLGEYSDTINGNYNIYKNNLLSHETAFGSFIVENNYFKLISNSTYPKITFNYPSNQKIYRNTFEGYTTLQLGMINTPPLNYENIFGNKFILKNASSISVSNPPMMMVSGNSYIGKNVNGKYLGNFYLDKNGNDIFTCGGNLQDITYRGTTYKVCDTPVLIGSSGMVNIYDYIIVTNTTAGGQQPTQAPLPPTAILDLSNYFPLVNDFVKWNISKSFDSDGFITNTKLYIDNVLYENVNTSQFTNTFPATIGLTLEVTDNDGLKDTIYRTLDFTDTNNNCAGNSVPYGEIKKTNLGGDLWKFEVINQFDADNDTILSKVWTANYKEIQTNVLTTTIGYNQTVYVRLFDGCGSGTAFTRVGSSINVIPDKTTEPIVNLNCGLSSQSPISSLNCNLNYDLKGFPLSSIKWFYDGSELLSQNNLTTFSFSVNDLNNHNVLVEVKSTQNVNSGIYTFKLVNDSIYLNSSEVLGCTDNTATNYNPLATINDGSCLTQTTSQSSSTPYSSIDVIDYNSVDNTNANTIGFMQDIIGFVTNVGIPLGILLVVIISVFAVLRLLM